MRWFPWVHTVSEQLTWAWNWGVLIPHSFYPQCGALSLCAPTARPRGDCENCDSSCSCEGEQTAPRVGPSCLRSSLSPGTGRGQPNFTASIYVVLQLNRKREEKPSPMTKNSSWIHKFGSLFPPAQATACWKHFSLLILISLLGPQRAKPVSEIRTMTLVY